MTSSLRGCGTPYSYLNGHITEWIFKNKFCVDPWPLKMRPIGCNETPVRNYHYSLLSNLEERSSQGPGCFTNEIFCNTSVSLTCLDTAQLPKSVHSVSVFWKFGERSDRTNYARVHNICNHDPQFEQQSKHTARSTTHSRTIFSPSSITIFSPSYITTFSPSYITIFSPSYITIFCPSYITIFSTS